MIQLNIDHNQVEKQKQFRRDLWDYKRSIYPCHYLASTGPSGHLCANSLKAGCSTSVNAKAIEKSLELIPDDYIPWARVTVGYMTIATMFGMEIHWSDDPTQPPGAKGHLIHDLEQVFKLPHPGIESGMMPENVRRLRQHAANLPPDVYITGIDAGGPLNTCKDLIDTDLLYAGFYENPELYTTF